MSKFKLVMVRFWGWNLLLVGSVLVVVFVILVFDSDISAADRVGGIFAAVVFGAVAFGGFKLIRHKPKDKPAQRMPNIMTEPYARHEAEQAREKARQSEASADKKTTSDDADRVIAKTGNATVISHADRGEQKTKKPMPEQAVDYSPLLDLLSETKNDTGNDYLPFNPPITVDIIYSDKNDGTTLRKVDIAYIAKSDYSDGYYFSGFCHLRNEKRNFNVPRLQKAMINEDEEVDFISYLVDTYRQSDQYKATMLAIKTDTLLASDGEAGTAAWVLTYIARAGGIFTRKAKVTIAQYIQEIEGTENGIEVDNYIIALEQMKPTTPEYKSLVKKAQITQSLLDKAESIVGKDPMRQGAFEILATGVKKKGLTSSKSLAEQSAQE